MNVAGQGHLTYCTNIHPGETWSDTWAQLQQHLPAVKHALSPDTPFGVGLRLSAEAARTLAEPDVLEAFRDWLDNQGLYVFTLNGFPYGNFHGEVVREAVYRPDWSDPERLEYTRLLGRILATLLPADTEGSISTVPGGFKPDIIDRRYRQRVVANLVRAAAQLRMLALAEGPRICLALEPEPACMLETTDESIEFFCRELFTAENARELARLTGETEAASAAALREHLGVCLDTCHVAVMFEDPLTSAQRFAAAGIRIAKLQLTAALAIENVDATTIAELEVFADPVYLHQTTLARNNAVTGYLDLQDACDAWQAAPDNCRLRSHFHVPVFLETLGSFQSTAPSLSRLLEQHRQTPFSSHLEVETYTFEVLPEQFRQAGVDENIRRELAWVLARLQP